MVFCPHAILSFSILAADKLLKEVGGLLGSHRSPFGKIRGNAGEGSWNAQEHILDRPVHIVPSLPRQDPLVKARASRPTRCTARPVMQIIQTPVQASFLKSPGRTGLLYLPRLRPARQQRPLEGCTKGSCLGNLKGKCHSGLGFKMRNRSSSKKLMTK